MGDGEKKDFTSFLADLRGVLGPEGLLSDDAARLVYSRDASHLTLGRPLAVALPADELQLNQVIGLCRAARVPVVCRGSGTGLSGGAVPGTDALVLGTGRLTELGPVDTVGRRVRVQPGVLNDSISHHGAASGLHFAPDPSSQAAASIGGNIAENAGGPHCLRHGVTLKHLLNLEWTDARGRSFHTGWGSSVERGLNLLSLLCGSEGTLGLVTAADLKLVRNPVSKTTLLAFFPVLENSVRAVVGLLGEGLAPVAVEIVDQAMLVAVEEAFGFGFATDVAAAMIMEFAGPPEETEEDGNRAVTILREHGAREVRQATDGAERAELWKCRKKAFGAVGRLAPSYVTMDVVVPLGELPGLVGDIQTIKKEHEVEIATAFHAGDGNLHPGVHYDNLDPDQTRRAHAAADTIIRAALDRGGSVTGEHGVGIEKLHALPWQLDAESARLQRGIKQIFDPDNILNPGKLLPPAEAEYAPVKDLPGDVDFQWPNLTVTAPASASLEAIQQAALERGFWIPVGALMKTTPRGLGYAGSVGDLVENLVAGPSLCSAGMARDYLLELWAETGDGRVFHSGAPVFKNVAGYDLAHMLCGSGQIFVRPLAATFQLRPFPRSLGCWRYSLPENIDWEDTTNRVLTCLADREDSLGGPVVVGDSTVTGERCLTVFAPGRDREWDLGKLGAELETILSGATMREQSTLPFGHFRELMTEKFLPEWALSSKSWNHLADTGGGGTGTTIRPSWLNRWIWQAAPRLVWTPDYLPPRGGWILELFTSDDEVVPPQDPCRRLPWDLLREMKSLFDPAGNLPPMRALEETDD